MDNGVNLKRKTFSKNLINFSRNFKSHGQENFPPQLKIFTAEKTFHNNKQDISESTMGIQHAF